MNNKYVYIVIIGLLLVLIILLYQNSQRNVVYKIAYEYMGTIEMEIDYFKGYNLFYAYSDLEKVLMNEFNYDAKKDSLIQSLNFNKYDFIITYRKEAIGIEYDKNYSKKHDHCEYIKDLKPIKVMYSNEEYEHKIFVYKVFEKGKYRHLCP